MASPPKRQRVAAVAAGRLEHPREEGVDDSGQPLGALVAQLRQPLGERREPRQVGHDHGALDLVAPRQAARGMFLDRAQQGARQVGDHLTAPVTHLPASLTTESYVLASVSPQRTVFTFNLTSG